MSYIGGFLKDSAAGSQEEGFSIHDLITNISEEIVESRGSGSIGCMEYALIDCGGDGKKQLALCAYGEKQRSARHYRGDERGGKQNCVEDALHYGISISGGSAVCSLRYCKGDIPVSFLNCSLRLLT